MAHVGQQHALCPIGLFSRGRGCSGSDRRELSFQAAGALFWHRPAAELLQARGPPIQQPTVKVTDLPDLDWDRSHRSDSFPEAAADTVVAAAAAAAADIAAAAVAKRTDLRVARTLGQLAAERAGVLRIVKVNADVEPALSSRLGVKGIPTLVLFDKGVEVSRQVGALPAHQLRDWIDGATPQARR